mgnify:CR=1 FL=1
MANLRRINQEDLRNHNLSVTLDTLLRAQKPMSRADLAKETGLTKATLSLLASMLIESGVVQEGEPVVSTTYGRPSTPLEIRGGSIAGIGLQINTDGYGCLALDLNGDTLGREWVSEDMTGTDPYEIFAKLDAMTFPLESRLKRRGCKVVGAGFALPGIVTDDMWLLVARNLGWENVNLTRFNVVRRLDVVAGNEAKMAAIAQIPGYATERAPFLNVVDRTDSFIYLSTDIGIGGAVVRDGEVVGFSAESGEDTLASIIHTDEGSRRFGEISLVPVQSPIYQSGRIFYDTLLDENAVCHMALGRGTPGVLPGGYELARSELDALGVNSSAIHVDFMIGSKHFDVEADTRAGKRITIMKNGSWAI